MAQRRAPDLVAADGGANRLLELDLMPQAVIGDLDSLSLGARQIIAPERLHQISEQATTDFDKALRSIDAPIVLGVGFIGGRIDHALATLNALLRHADRPCILIGPKDITFAVPERAIKLMLRPKDTLSLFPLAPVVGKSSGLRWPIEGLHFAPDGFIGTSNEVTEREVTLEFNRKGMLLTLPRGRLDAAIVALKQI